MSEIRIINTTPLIKTSRLTISSVESRSGGGGYFGPGQPVPPAGPPDEAGRKLDYPIGYNLWMAPKEHDLGSISFAELRALADAHDITRLLIETRKDQLEALSWQIQPITEDEDVDPTREQTKRAKDVLAFFKRPDGVTPFGTWLRQLVEDLLVLDAPCNYVNRKNADTRFEVVSGDLIKLLVDEQGRRPQFPDPAYSQVIKGMPAWLYDSTEMFYSPRNPRPHRIYGYSPVQQIILNVNTSLRKQVAALQYYCYADDTEVMTKRGWLRFADTTTEDEFATRQIGTGVFEWQQSTKVVREPYKGPMIHFSGRSVDQLVTPNHRMLVQRGSSHQRHFQQTESIMTAEDLMVESGPSIRVPLTSRWIGGVEIGEKDFTLNDVRSKPCRMTGDQYCAFMGMYLADGNLHHRGGIAISASEGSRKYEVFGSLMSELFSTGVAYSGHQFEVCRTGLAQHLRQFGGAVQKFVPDEIRNASSRQLAIFLRYYLTGDGTTTGNMGLTTPQAFTVSPRLADHLTEIGQKLGYAPTVWSRPAGVYKVEGRRGQSRAGTLVSFSRTATTSGVHGVVVPYNGEVHCVTVPNSFLYVRRNGKAMWCGNTEGNVPDAIIQVPKEWTANEVMNYEQAWNAIHSGNTAERRRAKFVPGEAKLIQTKEIVLKNDFDEWLTRVACFAFSISPTAFIKQMNRATSDTAKVAAAEEGLQPLMKWVKFYVDSLLQDYLGQTDMEFIWAEQQEVDPAVQAKVWDTNLKNGSMNINEVRDDMGLDSIDGGDTNNIYIGNAVMPVSQIEANAELQQQGVQQQQDQAQEKHDLNQQQGQQSLQHGEDDHALSQQQGQQGLEHGEDDHALQQQQGKEELRQSKTKPKPAAAKKPGSSGKGVGKADRPFVGTATDIDKYNPDEPRDDHGRWTSEGGIGFVSPNIAENTKFSDAMAQLHGEETARLMAAAKQGEVLPVQVSPAIGAWADGAEHTLLEQFSNRVSYEAGAAAMAAQGLYAHQKAVLWFYKDAAGPNAMYRFTAKTTDLAGLHTALLRNGVEFHTIVPKSGSATVYVYDESGSNLATSVRLAAKEYQSNVTANQGRGEFIGSWTSREEGAQIFRDRIAGSRTHRVGDGSRRRGDWYPGSGDQAENEERLAKGASKEAKAEANYRNPSDIKGERCENCTFMVDDGTCDKVVGVVQPPAICDYYQSAVTKQDGADLDHAAARADRDASPAKHRAGNYRKGHIIVHGLDIAIEAMRGSVRRGIGKDGTPWKAALPAHYGYIKRTRGADQEQVDVFIGQQPDAHLAWIIDQLKTEDRAFDEHKIMLGFPDFAAALHCYVSAFSDGKGLQRIGHITQVTIPQLKRWLRHGDLTKPRSCMVKGRRATVKPVKTRRLAPVDPASPDFDPYRAKLAAQARRVLKGLRSTVLADLRPVLDKLTKAPGDEINQLDLSALTLFTGDALDTIEAVAQDAARQAIASFGVPVRTSLVNQVNAAAAAWAREHAAELVTRLDDATRNELRDTIAAAIEDGSTIDDMTKAISEGYAFSDRRAELIAETECLLGETSVSSVANVRAVHRRFYDGEVVELITKSGRSITATPNHPMLTKRGWRAAGLIDETDDLICDARFQSKIGPDNVKDGPATIAEIFDAVSLIGRSQRVLSTPKDFHGDGGHGKVDVATSDRKLTFGAFVPLDKEMVQSVLGAADFSGFAFCSFCGALLPVNKSQHFCHRTDPDSSADQRSSNGVSANSITRGDSLDCLAVVVCRDDGFDRQSYIKSSRIDPPIDRQLSALIRTRTSDSSFLYDAVRNVFSSSVNGPRLWNGGAAFVGMNDSLSDVDSNGIARVCLYSNGFGSGPQLAVSAQDPVDYALRNTGQDGNFSNTQPAAVEFDQVSIIRRKRFAGHVFNLTTDCGYFTVSNGSFTGNTNFAVSHGALTTYQAAQEAGVEMQKEWLAEADACPICMDNMDDGAIELDDLFSSDDDAPPAHVNCRCAISPVVIEDSLSNLEE